jgi:hypothetical protein
VPLAEIGVEQVRQNQAALDACGGTLRTAIPKVFAATAPLPLQHLFAFCPA